jgi:kexin
LLFATFAGCDTGGGALQHTQTVSQAPAFALDDPLRAQQWYLEQRWSEGVDIGYRLVDPAVSGEGVVVAVVDDGMDYRHADLAANFSEELSYNYINQSGLPNAGTHGTHNAGIIAAQAGNGEGITGIAPHATLAAYNLLVNPSSVNEADAMVRNLDAVGVSNNSWGPPDGSGELWPQEELMQLALETGVTEGRNGKGIVYLWGGGNGQPADNSNYDGYANNPYVLAIGSVNERGELTTTSEAGANLWLVAPTEGNLSGYDIVTTDVTGAAGSNNGGSDDLADADYTQFYKGTSAATAEVSGVVALMRAANPELTWRDLRMILARSAEKNDVLDPDWTNNASTYQYHVNHQYGFGLLNAAAAVELAGAWAPLPPALVHSYTQAVGQAIPDNDPAGIVSTISVPSADLLLIEYVTVEVDIPDHSDFGDLRIELRSPAGTVSTLAIPHRCQSSYGQPLARCQSALANWRFGVARLLEEGSSGDWTLSVSDQGSGDSAALISWGLTIHGYQ